MGSPPLTTSLSPRRAVSQTPLPSLLLPAGGEPLEADLLRRYGTAARLVDRLLVHTPRAVRLLEVGRGALDLLPRFLDPARVRVTRCDADRHAEANSLFDPDAPLPFGDAVFDCVVALDVLEHVPAERRRSFLADCLRVARHGFVFCCPVAGADTVEAEALAEAAVRRRHGRPHPALAEHRLLGLPREEDVLGVLRDLDVPHAVQDDGSLETWLAGLLLSEELDERQAPAEVRRR